MEVQAGLLAIGNEVVEGQITNSNGSWLAQHLKDLGIRTAFQVSCRDRAEEIQASLNFLAPSCSLILTCGGLGPTQDDFTRQSISRWLGTELKPQEDLWQDIQKKLLSRNVVLREGHKNQCLIPNGSQPLENKTGVAPGFFSRSPQGPYLAALPGPPHEMKTMFHESLAPLLQETLKPKKDFMLKTWLCLGVPESEIAHIVESLIGSSLEIGFRLKKPYVEVKLWVPTKVSQEIVRKIDRMEQKIAPWFVAHTTNEIREAFRRKIQDFQSVFIVDQMTSGLFLERLAEGPKLDNLRYQCFENKNFRHFHKEEVSLIINHMGKEFGSDKLLIGLFPKNEHSAFVSFNENIHDLQMPRQTQIRSTYGLSYVIEKCFIEYIHGY